MLDELNKQRQKWAVKGSTVFVSLEHGIISLVYPNSDHGPEVFWTIIYFKSDAVDWEDQKNVIAW